MSHYKQVTHNDGVGGTYESTMTFHTDEIAALRAETNRLMAEHPADHPDTTQVHAITIAAFETSAALLECHDATGISLDNWIGPRELVEACLSGIGYPDGTFLENHV